LFANLGERPTRNLELFNNINILYFKVTSPFLMGGGASVVWRGLPDEETDDDLTMRQPWRSAQQSGQPKVIADERT
jgi:hypothetical protein